MTLISYAQNFEDVMLARALKGVETGFYIDVGANDASQLSVTKAFYERGWSGINVEPIKFWYEKLLTERPRDTNVPIAIAESGETVRLFNIVGTGLSTAIPDLADRHKAQGFEVEEHEVACQPLRVVCETHGVQEVHFLKIDVEGFEREVLASADFVRFRPWIVLVESTLPLSPLENHETWEPILLSQGYIYAYFDGLNRFYVAVEHDDLLRHFKAPPNVFDDFVTAAQHQAEAQTASTSAQLEKSKAEVAAASIHLQQLKTEVDRQFLAVQESQGEVETYRKKLQEVTEKSEDRLQELSNVYASLSWRLTAFLRVGNSFTKRFLREKIRPRAACSRVIRRAARSPFLRRLEVGLLRPFPSIQRRLRSIAMNEDPRQSLNLYSSNRAQASASMLSGDDDLTPEAQAILAELKAQLRSTQEPMLPRTERQV